MRGDDALDLVRVHVEARYEDHVFLAILDEHIALGIEPADIAGAQPLAHHDFRGLIRTIPITAHDLRTADTNLAHFVDAQVIAVIVANADFGRGNGQADG